MLRSNNDLSIIKNLKIEEVAQRLGITGLHRTGNSLQGHCPTGHASEGGRCFSINLEGNYFNCFHCGIGGDIISLVEVVNDINFAHAVQWLKESFNLDVDLSTIKLITEEQRKEQTEKYQRAGLLEQIYEYGKRLLYQSEGKEALDYLVNERGYQIDNLKKTEWFYFPPVSQIKQYLLSQQLEAFEQIDSLKLHGYYGDKFRLAFPYRNRYGVITGFLKRATEPCGVDVTTYDRKEHTNIRWDSTPGLKKDDLFNLQNCKNCETILIVEGYPDALYLPTLGITNIVAVGQGMLSKTHLEGLTEFGIKNVIISFDNDEVGPINTEKALEILKNKDINTFVLEPTELGCSKDPDEYVKANDVETFRLLVNGAVHSSKWIAKRIISKYDLTKDIARQNALESALHYDLDLKEPIAHQEFIASVSAFLNIPIDAIETKAITYREKLEREKVKHGYQRLLDDSSSMLKKGDLENVVDLYDKRCPELKNAFYKTKISPSLPLHDFFRQKHLTDSKKELGLLGYDLTRFSEIAKNIDGVQTGLYLIGAETNAGKTALLTNLALDIMETNPDVKCLYFSLDDSKDVITNRFLGILTRLPLNQVQRKQKNDADIKTMCNAYDKLIDYSQSNRLHIKDLSDIDHINQVEVGIREMNDKNLVVFIDGLYNLEVDRVGSGIREENIERANKLKILVDTYHIPIICTGELRKKPVEKSEKSKPTINDFMETGKFGYNANVVWLLSPKNVNESKTSNKYTVVLDYAKNKLSHFKGTQDLTFIKNKGIMREGLINVILPNSRLNFGGDLE